MYKQLYSVLTKNSDGSWKHQYYASFNFDEDVEKYKGELNSKGGAEFDIKEAGKVFLYGEQEETVAVDDALDGEDTPQESNNSTGETLDVVEETTTSENQLDYDWEDDYNKEDFPIGWWLNKEFVAKDGTVFDRKVEQPELYRTLEPSDY